MKFTTLIIVSFSFLFPLRSVFAVPPPDFIIQVASQIGTFFTIGVAIISSLYLTAYQYLKFYFSRKRKYLIIGGVIFIPISAIIFTGVGDYFYQKSENLKESQEWIEQSKINTSKESSTKIENQENNNSVLAYRALEYRVSGEVKKTYSPVIITGASIKYNIKKSVLSNIPLFISNAEFTILLQKEEPYILDAREDIEYSMGHIPNSIHARFADLKNGEWKNLPRSKTIYVVCWSGMRGKEVAEFLRSKGVEAQYLEKGVDGWVNYGGKWEGEVKFSKSFPEERYNLVYTTSKLKEMQGDNLVIVDARSPTKFSYSNIKNSINIPLLETPINELNRYFNTVPEKSQVITICDEYINCFAARLVGIELEKRRKVTFLGRYNKPWEY